MTTAITSVNSSTSSQALIAADGTRTSLVIANTDANRLYFLAGSGTATTVAGGFTDSIVMNQSVTMTPPESFQAWQGVWAGDGAGGASITAITDPVADDNGTISTYAELKTALAAWLKPGTSLPAEETASRIPEYIALFEAEANRTLRTRNMDAVDTALTITSGSADVPTGFREVRSFRLTEYPYNEIRYLPIDQIERMDPADTDLPFYYDIVGANFIFYPPTTSTARLRFRRGLTPLTSDNDTNWLLAKHPDAYLFGSLSKADRRLIDPERVQLVQPSYEAAMSQILSEDRAMIGHALHPQPSGFVV